MISSPTASIQTKLINLWVDQWLKHEWIRKISRTSIFPNTLIFLRCSPSQPTETHDEKQNGKANRTDNGNQYLRGESPVSCIIKIIKFRRVMIYQQKNPYIIFVQKNVPEYEPLNFQQNTDHFMCEFYVIMIYT